MIEALPKPCFCDLYHLYYIRFALAACKCDQVYDAGYSTASYLEGGETRDRRDNVLGIHKKEKGI